MKRIEARNRKRKRQKTGPKRSFTDQQLQDVRDLVGKAGYTNKHLAMYFDVDITTIEYWTKNYSDFQDAVKKGRIETVLTTARSLFTKANGYSTTLWKTEMAWTKEYDEQGRLTREYQEPMKIPYQKYFPIDANAAYKLLNVLYREEWGDIYKGEIRHTHEGEIQHTHKTLKEIDTSEFSEEVQKMLFEVGMKQIGEGKNNN
jgi:hypothetical protein